MAPTIGSKTPKRCRKECNRRERTFFDDAQRLNAELASGIPSATSTEHDRYDVRLALVSHSVNVGRLSVKVEESWLSWAMNIMVALFDSIVRQVLVATGEDTILTELRSPLDRANAFPPVSSARPRRHGRSRQTCLWRALPRGDNGKHATPRRPSCPEQSRV